MLVVFIVFASTGSVLFSMSKFLMSSKISRMTASISPKPMPFLSAFPGPNLKSNLGAK